MTETGRAGPGSAARAEDLPLPSRERLFFALWPDAGVRSAMTELLGELSLRGGKAVPAENLHITLLFLGNMDARERACAEAVAARIAVPSFALRLDRIGFWPRSGLLWLGSSALPDALARLAAELHSGVAGCGVALDARPFLAHVTLMRKLRVVRHAGPVGPIDWQVGGFALVRSDRSSEGSCYRILGTWPLVG